MIPVRTTDPTALDQVAIRAAIDDGRTPVIQFSEPPGSSGLLRTLNQLCIELGDRIQVRFFGYYGRRYDASVLSSLPDVRWLSVDSLDQIENESHLCRLEKLTRLAFGVYNFDHPRFLEHLPLENLTHLTLVENKKRNFDLMPLGRGEAITDLFINGHTKNIGAIAVLPKLKTLGLSAIKNQQELGFLCKLADLQALTLILGGRQTFDEFSHAGLQELTIIRLRGLETLGDLGRFPNLRKLHLEDQLQIGSISFEGARLTGVEIINCKNLEALVDLDALSSIESLRISGTKLDLDALAVRDWPASLDVLALYSGSRTWNARTRAALDKRGFRERSTSPKHPAH